MRKVLLLVESNSAVGRGITVGVWRALRGLDAWQIVREDLWPLWPKFIEDFDGDGVIARVRSAELAQALRAKRLPVVDVLGTLPEAGFPIVTVDDRAIGREGAKHFREMGHTRLAFVESAEQPWSVERRRGFDGTLAPHPVRVFDVSWSEVDVRLDEERVLSWLASLPRPVGIMACSDRVATHVVAICVKNGIAVPEAVSVLGADNDDMFCAMSDVPLSSVRTDHSRLGYEATLLLARMMRGDPAPRRPTLIAPDGVAVRASTDVVAIDDKVVASALRYIREHAFDTIDVADVARHAGVSRTPLQRRFHEALGRGVHEEIVRVRLERAKRLLSETDLAIAVVAERIRVGSQASLCRLFQSKLGTTPAKYRRDARGPRGSG
jgi:LacI family transcriptional regulator